MPTTHEPENHSSTSLSPSHDDLPRHRGRVHIVARQRGTDITALGALLLHLPHVLASLAVVGAASYTLGLLTGLPWWLPPGGWVLSGALIFHLPCERLIARWLFGLRHPTPDENGRLHPVWQEVTARAGVDSNAYELWIEESRDINAMAAAGHIVGVTSRSLRTLTPDQLGGVLAHELGHHTRGHAWASLLTVWYALPARLTWRAVLRLARRVDRLSPGTAAVVTGVAGAGLVALATATYGLILLPLAIPYLMAAVARRAELRADRHAAGLGFGPQLMSVLHGEHDAKDALENGAAGGMPLTKDRLMARLLSSHPDVHTRLHHLHRCVHQDR